MNPKPDARWGGPYLNSPPESSGRPFPSPLEHFDRFARHQTLCLYGATFSAFVAGWMLGLLVGAQL